MTEKALRVLSKDGETVGFELVEGELCIAQDAGHVKAFATWRAHLVQGPTLYCDACAAKMKRVYDALGTHMHLEAVDVVVLKRDMINGEEDDRSARAIDLG